MASSGRDQALPDRRAAGRRQPVDRREDVGLVAGRRVDRDPGVAERHEADDDARRLLLHDGLGDRPRGVHPRGRQVGRGHARRDVERDHHGALGSRQRHRRARTGERHDEDDEADDDEGAGHDRAPATTAAGAPTTRRRRSSPRAAPSPGRDAARRSPGPRGRPAARATSSSSSCGDRKLMRGPPPALAPRRHAHDRADQVLVGRQRHGVDAGPPKARASSASRAAAAASNRRRNLASCVSTTSCSPVSASSTTIGPMSGSAVSRGSTRRTASTSWRRLSRCSGFSQPGALMKSDTITTIERRLTWRWPPRTAPRGRSPARAQPRLGHEVAHDPQDLARPPAAGIVRSTSLAKNIAPTRLPRRVISRASVAVKSTSTERFCRPPSAVPKSTDGLRSSRNHAVISRSSWYSRTCGIVVRAVTFQSIRRTSSPGSYSRSEARSSPAPRNRLR